MLLLLWSLPVVLHLLCWPLAVAAAAKVNTIRIYVLIGESNMWGYGSYDELRKLAMAGKYKYLLNTNMTTTGTFSKRSDVRLTFNELNNNNNIKDGRAVDLTVGYGLLNKTFGPEVGFGKAIGDHFNDTVLLVKCATPGTRLGVEWRSPSNNRTYRGVKDPANYGRLWRTMVQMIDDVTSNLSKYVPGYTDETKYKIEGFVWMQGWNDALENTMREDYEANLEIFVDDLVSTYGHTTKILIVAMGQLGLRPKIYINESASVASILQAQTNVAKAKRPHTLLLPTSQYAVAVKRTNVYMPVDGIISSRLQHYFGRAETFMNIGFAAARAMIQSAPTTPTRKPTTRTSVATKSATRTPTR